MGKPSFGAVGGEAVIAFEDVFVPTERVFMDGEAEFAGDLVYRFAAHQDCQNITGDFCWENQKMIF